MKKLYLMMSVLLACGLFCACSDEEDIVVDNYDATYQVKYYNLDPDLYKTQRRWYYDKPIEMYPQKEPPYTLMVKWDSDEGKQALDHIVGKNDGVLTNRYDHDYENMSIIVCNKYISCPYLYVSSSYKESESFLYENEFHELESDDETSVTPCHAVLPKGKTAKSRTLGITATGGTTGIYGVSTNSVAEDDDWFDLHGRNLSCKPTRSGLYIHNGKKEIIK